MLRLEGGPEARIAAHPYDRDAYLNVHAEGWEKRLGHEEGRRR